MTSLRRAMHLNLATLVLGAMALTAPAMAAAAQAWPQRPVRLIIPYPPGGAGDIVGRMLANSLSAAFGQQVVVDNRGGGGQVIATQITANAPADGYTLFLSSATHSINPALRKNLPYDTLRDFAPISLVAESPLVFVAHPNLKVASIAELIAAGKAQPGRINYASSGPGTGGHMSVELLQSLAGVRFTHIPYKGAGPALVDVVSGQVPFICTSPLPSMPHVKAGRLRALGMTSLKRAPAYPDVPAVAETVPGYQSTLWYALLAPARTPQPILQRVHGETVRALAAPQLREQLLGLGATPIGGTPQELQAFIAAEIKTWVSLVQQANIRLE
jgi:tripartite-type tricarboxylate transporter receptor subunit TctC